MKVVSVYLKDSMYEKLKKHTDGKSVPISVYIKSLIENSFKKSNELPRKVDVYGQNLMRLAMENRMTSRAILECLYGDKYDEVLSSVKKKAYEHSDEIIEIFNQDFDG